MKRKLLVFLWSAALALTLAACKQGEGETCQIDDDCQSGLECNAGTMKCQRPGSSTIDAGPGAPDAGPDAGPTDAGPADAGPDAGPDAGIDAGP